MKEFQRTTTRERMTRLLEQIPDEWLEVLLPTLVGVAAAVRRFFAAARHAAEDVLL